MKRLVAVLMLSLVVCTPWVKDRLDPSPDKSDDLAWVLAWLAVVNQVQWTDHACRARSGARNPLYSDQRYWNRLHLDFKQYRTVVGLDSTMDGQGDTGLCRLGTYAVLGRPRQYVL